MRRTRARYHYAIRPVKSKKRPIKEAKYGIVNKSKEVREPIERN